MTKTLLQEGLDAYARGDYLAAARAWCRGRIENPKDAALSQYLQALRNLAPAVVAGAEEEAAANAKAARPPAAVGREPSRAMTPLIDAPDQGRIPGRTIDMSPTELRPGKTVDMSPTDLHPGKAADVGLSVKPPEPEDFPDPPQARIEDGRSEWPPSLDVHVKADEVPALEPQLPSSSVANDDVAAARAAEVVSASVVELEVAASSTASPASVTDDAPGTPDPWGGPALLGPTASADSAAPGLALVAEVSKVKSDPAVSVATLVTRMRDAAGLDDFSGALKAADELLTIEPLNVDAKRIRERARSVLTQMLVSELGTLDAIPVVVVAADQVIWLDLDQRSGFVLAQVDGRSSFSDIVAVTGMDELETLGILARLVRDKIVVAR